MSVLIVVQFAWWSSSAFSPIVSYEFTHSDRDPELAQKPYGKAAEPAQHSVEGVLPVIRCALPERSQRGTNLPFLKLREDEIPFWSS